MTWVRGANGANRIDRRRGFGLLRGRGLFVCVGGARRARPPTHVKADAAPVDCSVIALVGLAFEARIASGPGVVAICRNSERELAASLDQALKQGCRGIISFGVAGGLAPHLRPGNWVVASSIVDAQHTRSTDRASSEKILAMIPGAEHGPIAGVDYAIATTEAKRRMHVETGAATVDMEIIISLPAWPRSTA